MKNFLALSLSDVVFIMHQGFSLVSALGHSPKLVPGVREFDVQFGQFVRDDFRKRTVMHSDPIVFLFYKRMADWPKFCKCQTGLLNFTPQILIH